MALVTAHHTNRQGDESMADHESRGGVDKVKVLGRHNLVDAHAVEDPIDASIYVVPEYNPIDGITYLTIKRGKQRFKSSTVDYLAYPLRNRFFIDDDILLDKPKSIESLKDVQRAEMKPTSSEHAKKISARDKYKEGETNVLSFDMK